MLTHLSDHQCAPISEFRTIECQKIHHSIPEIASSNRPPYSNILMLSRLTNAGSTRRCSEVNLPKILDINKVAALFPILVANWSTLDKPTIGSALIEVLSKPTTDRSPGTFIFLSCATDSNCNACMSLQQNTPSGFRAHSKI